MTGYNLINLINLINEIGEDNSKNILSNFSCPLNKDLEHFLHYNAIIFSKQRLAATYLVFSSYKDKPTLIGYFTIATKVVNIKRTAMSSRMRNRISKFSQYNNDTKVYTISSPLIAQLGKNFKNGINKLITGDELLKLACDKVKEIQMLSSGKITYLECENVEKLINFYTSNGFFQFDKRQLDRDETNLKGEYLIQLLKYID